MPGSPDLSQVLLVAWPIAEAVGLHFLSREAFRDSEDSKERKRECIDALKSDHADSVFRYLDNELVFERFVPDNLSLEDKAKVDEARRKEAERIADAVWGDALVARNLEYWWLGWRHWEMIGRIACDVGRLLAGIVALVFLVLLLLGASRYLGQSIPLLVALILLGAPLIVALVSILPKAVMQNQAMRILDAPDRGTIRGIRRFGSA